MRGLVITTDTKMYVKDFAEPLWKTVGHEVGGLIEIVHPVGLERPLCMIVDEEGLLKPNVMNVVGSFLYGFEKHGHPIVGNIVLMKEGIHNGEPDIVGLDNEDIDKLAKYVEELTVGRVMLGGEVI